MTPTLSNVLQRDIPQTSRILDEITRSMVRVEAQFNKRSITTDPYWKSQLQKDFELLSLDGLGDRRPTALMRKIMALNHDTKKTQHHAFPGKSTIKPLHHSSQPQSYRAERYNSNSWQNIWSLACQPSPYVIRHKSSFLRRPCTLTACCRRSHSLSLQKAVLSSLAANLSFTDTSSTNANITQDFPELLVARFDSTVNKQGVEHHIVTNGQPTHAGTEFLGHKPWFLASFLSVAIGISLLPPT